LLIPLAVFLWIPGVIWVAEKIYMWISRNRHLLSRLFGCKQACALLPERKRPSN
jgi:predicted DCC family thiol-disulfide oxidoreductase YuxK